MITRREILHVGVATAALAAGDGTSGVLSRNNA